MIMKEDNVQNIRWNLFRRLVFFVLGGILLITGNAKGQTTDGGFLPTDSCVKIGHLPNGFTYYIRRNTEPKDRVTMYLVNKVGSILEDEGQRGLAHFMEHMSFNGTTHFPKNELVDYLQKAGVRFGGDLNAYTNFDETVYELPIPTDDPTLLHNGFQIMRDWAQDATLSPVEIEKERGVILEEKRLRDGVQQRLRDRYFPIVLNGSKYAYRVPIGLESIIKNFKYETLRRFYKDWYRPDLQALIVVGDIDVQETEKTIVDMFSDLKMPAKPRERKIYTIPLLNKNQFFSATDKELQTETIEVLVKHPEEIIKSDDDFRKALILSLLNRMLGSRYYELSQQANPPFIQAGADITSFIANLEVADAQVSVKPGEEEKGFKALWTEIERIRKFGFTKTELERAKSDLLMAYESSYKEKDKTPSDTYVKEYMDNFLKGNAIPGIDFEYQFVKKALPHFTVDDVNRIMKTYFNTVTNRDILVMAPETSKGKLPSQTDVEQWMKEVADSALTPYKDSVSGQTLLQKKITGGKIVSERELKELGITELKLSNGLKVLLKPTDFKDDEISFFAYSLGGTSLSGDKDFESADAAARLVNNSGLGNFNAIELSKFLNGKRVNVSPFMSERFEGLQGQMSLKDMKTAFQMMYGYFEEPRADSVVFTGLLSKEKAILENRSNNPTLVFRDSVSAILGNYNIRRTGPSVKKLDEINISKAFSIYKERFADASDFTFVFVGSFKVDSIKPFVAKYLGALPQLNRKEQACNLNIHFPSGRIKKEIFNGIDNRSTVELVFSGKYNYTTLENTRMNALSRILTIRLTEDLREKESGVYGVGAYAHYSKYPENRYSLFISFSCKPGNVQKLIDETLKQVKELEKEGPSLVDVNKFKAERTRQLEVSLKSNDFWLNYLGQKCLDNAPLDDVLTYSELVNSVKPKDVRKVARDYLSGKNFIQIVLYPKQVSN